MRRLTGIRVGWFGVMGMAVSVQLAYGEAGLYETVELPLLNGTLAASAEASEADAGAVRFARPADPNACLDLHEARWPALREDPGTFYEDYDQFPKDGPTAARPMLRVPKADYVAAHVLATAADDPTLGNTLTLRTGKFGGGGGQVLLHDFSAEVPRGDGLRRVRIPFDTSFAQDIEGDTIDIELTKQVRLARRSPDPARFRYRPVGLPSGVKLAALTLEKSPLQWSLLSDERGNAFVEPGTPVFKATLRNITDQPQAYTLTARAQNPDGAALEKTLTGSVPAGQEQAVELRFDDAPLGYFDLTATLAMDGDKQLIRTTSFALLPETNRPHRATSPWGTWDYSGRHFTKKDADRVGPLFVKAGMRYGMFHFTPEERARFGVVRGATPKISKKPEGYQITVDRHPDMPKIALIFHEDSISGPHTTRTPDLFHDRPDYKLNEKEQLRFEKLWGRAITAGRYMREHHPDAHVRFGNGPLPVKEEFLRQGFPPELFDSLGNEAGNFGRPPEAQPPDWVAHNAGIWMDRQLLDGYGYSDKPVHQCYEIGYPGTNPGNLTELTQAAYYPRLGLHSLAWDIPEIRIGLIVDAGNSYHFSNWGGSGFCRRFPEMAVKPSFVSVATMTSVLDGVEFQREVSTGSTSVFCLEFTRPDGQTVWGLWTPRGEREITMKLPGDGSVTAIDWQHREAELKPADDGTSYTLQLNHAPQYVVSGRTLEGLSLEAPQYDNAIADDAVQVGSWGDSEAWAMEREPDPVLDSYNFMTPRRMGDFAAEPVAEHDGHQNVMRVTPRSIAYGKDTMPMYGVLRHGGGGVALPDRDGQPPTAIGLWVHGNSSWGRVIFDLVDANGERWTSIGAPQTGEVGDWQLDWMPEEAVAASKLTHLSDWNTDDVFGTSRIDFEGWRWVSMPLPGHYPGEGYGWPANSQWRFDGDGRVDYPLTLSGVVVQLPEKTLHVKRFEAVPEPSVWLGQIGVTHRDPEAIDPATGR